jgi:hypothetical protein
MSQDGIEPQPGMLRNIPNDPIAGDGSTAVSWLYRISLLSQALLKISHCRVAFSGHSECPGKRLTAEQYYLPIDSVAGFSTLLLSTLSAKEHRA